MLVIRLIGPVMRAIDWIPLLVTGPLSLALIGVIDAGAPLDSGMALTLLRMLGLLLAAAAGFAVLDEMAPSTAATPAPRRLRHRIRYAAGGLTAAAFWAAACTIATARLAEGGTLRIPGLAVEAATCIAAGLLTTTIAARRHHGRSAALRGMGGLLAVFAVTLVLRGPYWPWLNPTEPTWEVVHYGWSATLVLVVIALDSMAREPHRTRHIHTADR
ncbi:hypothetical protein [Sinosporangium siamense]|uniref:Uncharacterized protein n=1 Tax=Sinosporangium siamense TaxID=1367973 RepID=A0A919RFB6_9ACTN|nr:hypothetical protein [Sinosporangium siamense]GII90729.1 hypothetical protein Ssi02_09600 [Sinosporangium siamense]